MCARGKPEQSRDGSRSVQQEAAPSKQLQRWPQTRSQAGWQTLSLLLQAQASAHFLDGMGLHACSCMHAHASPAAAMRCHAMADGSAAHRQAVHAA